MRATALVLGFVVLVACKREQPGPAGDTAAPSAAPAKAEPEPAPKPWFEGTWTGTYQAALHRVELPVGGVRAWRDDDGSAASGEGTLKVAVDADGVAHGEARGPLGPLAVTGQVDEQSLRLMFAPEAGNEQAFRGALVAQRSEDVLSGTLHASSGDSLTVRAAKVELRRAAE